MKGKSSLLLGVASGRIPSVPQTIWGAHLGTSLVDGQRKSEVAKMVFEL